MATGDIQPSGDYSATCAAIAWAIVLLTNVGDDREKDSMKLAKKFRDVYMVVARGKKPESKSD